MKMRTTALMQSLTQTIFLKYVVLFAVVGLVAYVSIHYGTDWFKDASTNTVRVWEQAGVAFAIALAAAMFAFFGRWM